MERKKFLEVVTFMFVLFFIVLFVLSIIYKSDIEIFLGSNLESSGGIILLIIGFLIELIPNYLSPHIAIVNAYVLDISLRVTITYLLIGTILGSLLGFFIGKTYGVEFADDFVSREKISKIKKTMNEKGRWGVLLAALSPVPYLPIVLGAIRLSWKNFIIFGIIPRSIGIILLGFVVYAI